VSIGFDFMICTQVGNNACVSIAKILCECSVLKHRGLSVGQCRNGAGITWSLRVRRSVLSCSLLAVTVAGRISACVMSLCAQILTGCLLKVLYKWVQHLEDRCTWGWPLLESAADLITCEV
jgi:hypothetical protein